jgi:hypothetical protein
MSKTFLATILGALVWLTGCMNTPDNTGGGEPDLAAFPFLDMSHGGGGGGGGQDLAGGGGGQHDLAGSPPADLAGGSSGDGGGALLALCQTCTTNTECASGLCAPYMMGATMKCSHSCAAATAATDCPGVNACNGMNVCKCQ